MGKNIFVMLVFAGLALFSCKSNSERTDSDKIADNAIMQQQDGTISLEVTKADTYRDVNEPESSTAEWNVVVSKSGRYDVWLASATKDTNRLQYSNAVMLSVKDDLLEARPSVDKVIQNSTDVSYPYYRAESFLGSLYLKDTGVYSFQVISDRIVPEDKENNPNGKEVTKLLSVSLTPAD
jgi:hypothetical protein